MRAVILSLLLGALTPGVHAADASRIILPHSSERCWVWLAPPETLARSLKGFLSEASLEFLKRGELEAPARLTLDAIQGLPAGRIRIEEKQLEAIRIESRWGKIESVSLSVTTAEKLVRAAQAQDPGQLLLTGAELDRDIARAWLDALPTAKNNEWDNQAAHDQWRASFENPAAAAHQSPRELAQRLWPRLDQAYDKGDVEYIAKKYGEGSSGEAGYSVDMLKAFIQQGSYREAFLELGRRAASLVSARKLIADGEIKPLAGARLERELEAAYHEAFGVLARALDSRLIIIK